MKKKVCSSLIQMISPMRIEVVKNTNEYLQQICKEQAKSLFICDLFDKFFNVFDEQIRIVIDNQVEVDSLLPQNLHCFAIFQIVEQLLDDVE